MENNDNIPEIRNYVFNFGPQHPAAHGVLRLILEVDGETRVVALTRLGVAQIVSSATLAQEGDVVWLAAAGDRIDELDRRLGTAPGGQH